MKSAAARQRIFIVEDDDNIRDMLVYALTAAGFEASGFADSGELASAMKQELPQLLLLDIMLPGEDGVSILRRLRGSADQRFPSASPPLPHLSDTPGSPPSALASPCSALAALPNPSSLPVIMLTAKDTELDRIRGLDCGADDYITKPFSVLEVISRVKAVLRRCGKLPEMEELQVGTLKLNGTRRSVHVGEGEVILTYKEFELLRYMMLNEGKVLSRDRLLEQVWGFDYNGGSRTVDMHIKSLRQKLGDKSDLIRTVRNVGYKLGA